MKTSTIIGSKKKPELLKPYNQASSFSKCKTVKLPKTQIKNSFTFRKNSITSENKRSSIRDQESTKDMLYISRNNILSPMSHFKNDIIDFSEEFEQEESFMSLEAKNAEIKNLNNDIKNENEIIINHNKSGVFNNLLEKLQKIDQAQQLEQSSQFLNSKLGKNNFDKESCMTNLKINNTILTSNKLPEVDKNISINSYGDSFSSNSECSLFRENEISMISKNYSKFNMKKKNSILKDKIKASEAEVNSYYCSDIEEFEENDNSSNSRKIYILEINENFLKSHLDNPNINFLIKYLFPKHKQNNIGINDLTQYLNKLIITDEGEMSFIIKKSRTKPRFKTFKSNNLENRKASDYFIKSYKTKEKGH
jgi:hypothetical protein